MKTIVITVFSRTAKLTLRNLFLFEGSVFQILKKQRNLKIILVTRKSLFFDNEEFFKNIKLENNVELKVIESAKKDNLFIKLFSFFYKYLIFTDYTKMLAISDVRVDGNQFKKRKFFYFLKILNYNIFGKVEFIKKKLVPFLYGVFVREKGFSNFLNIISPDLIFLTNYAMKDDQKMLSESRRKNIKTVGIVGSWDHLGRYFIPMKPDKFLVWNEVLKNEAMDLQVYNYEDVKIAGIPHFDLYQDFSILMSRNDFFKKIGLSADKKLVFYGSGGSYFSDSVDIARMLISWKERKKLVKDFNLVIKPYPQAIIDVGKFEKFSELDFVNLYKEDNSSTISALINFINYLYHSDIIICVYSSIALEALALEKPIINVSFDGYKERSEKTSVKRFLKLGHYRNLLESKGISTAHSQKEFFKLINILLDNPEYRMKERKELRDLMCYNLDGNASKRIVKEIMEFF